MSTAASVATAEPLSFAFTADNLARAERIIAKYPAGKQASAVIPLLHLAQSQNDNWLSRAAMDHVADLLKMPRIRVYEVATFYTMFNKEPVGKHVIHVCTTTPCWLRGSDEIVATCKRKLGINPGETTPDGQFTVTEVECLGACVNAPMVEIHDHYYEDLDGPRMEALIDALARGEIPPAGPQLARQTSAPATGATTLTSLPRHAETAQSEGAATDEGEHPARKPRGKAKTKADTATEAKTEN
ncbi:NADH-quinone oxidoreductase subunit E [Azospirillaceae bacterium]